MTTEHQTAETRADPLEELRDALVAALREAAEAEATVWTSSTRPVVGTWGDRIIEAFERHGITASLDGGLREALAEWDAIEGSGLVDQFRAFIAAGKMADAIRAALAPGAPDHE